jgi:hypothetical protein
MTINIIAMTTAIDRSPLFIPFSINATKVRISEHNTKQKAIYFYSLPWFATASGSLSPFCRKTEFLSQVTELKTKKKVGT